MEAISYEYLCYLTRKNDKNMVGFHKSRWLGQGGEGSVYKGFDEVLNCFVAVKRLRFDRSGSFDREREVRRRASSAKNTFLVP